MNQAPTTETKRQRVWEVDAMRGFLILAVLINHLNMTVNAFCINGAYNIDSTVWASVSDPLGVWYTYTADGVLQSATWVKILREVCTYPAVSAFFVISGISCLFSRNNLRRGLVTLAAAYIISIFTKLLAVWTGDPNQFIRFGVLHCYGYCQIIYYFLFEKRKNKLIFPVAILALLVGYYLRYNPISVDTSLLLPFGFYENDVPASDYWPIFPMLGWLLCGVLIGRKFYLEKKSLFPTCLLNKWTRPLQFLGRHSGKIYIVHIFVYSIVFLGIGWLFGLM